MKRRTKTVLLVAGLGVTAAAAVVVGLTMALAQVVDPHQQCATGFSRLVDCTYHWTSRTTTQGDPDPAFAAAMGVAPPTTTFRGVISHEETSWAVATCPQNSIARRLLCANPAATPVRATSDDLVTGLPRPKPWIVTTARKSSLIESVHVETPLDLAGTLGFYRAALSQRGWTENTGAVVEPDRAVIAFATSDGPVLLRLTHQGDRTTADLWRHKGADANAGNLPKPEQARLILGNDTDEEAVITVNAQTITLAARTGNDFKDDAETGLKSKDSPEIDLPPGKVKVTVKLASGAAQNRTFEIAAEETWGLLAGPAGAPLPIHLY
jgi:hypothetical protein